MVPQQDLARNFPTAQPNGSQSQGNQSGQPGQPGDQSRQGQGQGQDQSQAQGQQGNQSQQAQGQQGTGGQPNPGSNGSSPENGQSSNSSGGTSTQGSQGNTPGGPGATGGDNAGLPGEGSKIEGPLGQGLDAAGNPFEIAGNDNPDPNGTRPGDPQQPSALTLDTGPGTSGSASGPSTGGPVDATGESAAPPVGRWGIYRDTSARIKSDARHAESQTTSLPAPHVRSDSLNETAPVVDIQISDSIRRMMTSLEEELASVIVGQRTIVRGVLTALLAGGNVLLEGVPGLGKTLLVRTLAECMNLTYSRIQFTPDLMPSDIVGTDVIMERGDGQSRGFTFNRGPIFANLILADEINRATPRTQSAMLEAMQEFSVTVGRQTHRLPQPFFVLATQNPIDLQGTYPLPEAQLDRFFFKLIVDYPSVEELKEIARRTTGRAEKRASVVISADQLLDLQAVVRDVPVAEPVLDYAARLVMATHPDGGRHYSPQAGPLRRKPPRNSGPRAGRQGERHHVWPLQRLLRRLASRGPARPQAPPRPERRGPAAEHRHRRGPQPDPRGSKITRSPHDW